MHRKKLSRGFTLIELMIVVAIIAILAAIAIPAYQNYLIRAQVTEGFSLATGAKSAVWDFTANTGRYPPNNASAGLSTAASISGHYASSVDVTNGLITVAYKGPQANIAINNKVLVLSPTTGAGSIQWSCSLPHTTIPGAYLPSSCRN
jgi:type IV pilus assembly protein PilA